MTYNYKLQFSTDAQGYEAKELFYTNAKDVRNKINSITDTCTWWIVFDHIDRKIVEKDNGTVTYTEWYDVPKVLEGLR